MAMLARLRAIHWPFALVLLMVLAAGAFVVTDRWRRGATLLGAAMMTGAVLRAALKDSQVGLLAVRNRPVDVATYSAFGVAILVLASSISSLGTV
ncbi:MAG: DUF3017 domain-containing protein [Mycobacteriaceae bacterium]|jgi:Protein of unknown function (DUF3017)